MNNTSLQTRRDFCLQACQLASLTLFTGTLGALLQSCSSDNPVASGSSLERINATLVNNTITLAIAAGSTLATVGNAVLVQYGNSAMLVARTAQNTFAAVSAICTHQSCTITNYGNAIYTCPCHGSQFNTNGGVTKGPATAALRSYATQFANEQLTITVS